MVSVGNGPGPSNGRRLDSRHLRALRLLGWMDLQRDLSLSVSLGPILGNRALRFGVKRSFVIPLQMNPRLAMKYSGILYRTEYREHESASIHFNECRSLWT